MNHILEIDTENATVRAEAGVVTSDLQAEVEKRGLFYPPDPSSIRHSTIGGNIACNAGGPRCLKYGVTGDYVLGLTVVLADGGILKTDGKPIKDVTGYDLNGLFTGSEGTPGLITEALLRLVAKPRYARTALAEFASLADASRTVNAILTAGIVPATLELMDQTAIVCIEEAMHLGLRTDVEASLIIETDGADEQTVLRRLRLQPESARRPALARSKWLKTRRSEVACGKRVVLFLLRWRAKRRTSLAKTSLCLAARSLKSSGDCERSAPSMRCRL
jgi:glycolate oxidase